jgi:putative DNA-invertase from lambdoid prophage Rac
VCVHCLALGGVDLTSSTGKLTMNVINAVAEFERDLLIERMQAGLS